MSLFEKLGKYEALVNKLPRQTIIPEAVKRTQKVAAKFEAKLERLAQDNAGASMLGGAVNAVVQQLNQTFQQVRMPDSVRAKLTQLYTNLQNLSGADDAASLNQIRAIVKSIGPLVSNIGAANNVLPVLSHLDQVVQKQQQAQAPAPGGAGAQQAGQPGAAVAAKGFPSIPTNVQQALSEIMVKENLGVPLAKIDGKLGPETQRALNNYFKKFPQKSTLRGKPLWDDILSYARILKGGPDLSGQYEASKTPPKAGL